MDEDALIVLRGIVCDRSWLTGDVFCMDLDFNGDVLFVALDFISWF